MNTKLQICVILFILVAAGAICCGVYFYEEVENTCDKWSEEDHYVNVRQGVLQGFKNFTSLTSKAYYGFLGIPYATPPLGDLRFKEPLRAEAWTGVRDATYEGDACVQIDFIEKMDGSEDCLYLNVFTPHFSDATARRYPVMVWFHGGGFTYNSASPKHYGPGLLLEQDVVLVTINYRVGAFGFLCVHTSKAPGNVGLKDQLMALKWVNDNIHSFGGDPYNITIFGESAGSASVQLHMLSPLSTGLFQKAIMESGSILNPWAFNDKPIPRAYQLGHKLGFKKHGSVNELVDFLKNVPAYELVRAQDTMIDKENQKQCLDFPFLPTIDVSGEVRFLPSHPRVLLANGHFSKVPTIIGVNSREGYLTLTDAFKTKSSYGRNYGMFVPEELGLHNKSTPFKYFSNDIKKFFFQDKPIDEKHITEFTDVCSDLSFVIGIHETIEYMNKHNVPLYIYLFSFDGKLRELKSLIQRMRPDIKHWPSGVSHADELGYIFPGHNTKKVSLDSPEIKTVKRVVSMWTNFAKHGHPYGEYNNVIWERSTKKETKYLDIGKNLTMVNDIFFPKRIKFWNSAMKKYRPKRRNDNDI